MLIALVNYQFALNFAKVQEIWNKSKRSAYREVKAFKCLTISDSNSTKEEIKMRGTLSIYRESSFWKDYEKAIDTDSCEYTLLRLSAHSSSSIRRQVAKNKNTPVYILGAFLHDSSVQVRASLATRQDLPVSYYWILSNDSQSSVKQNILKNPKTPNSIVLALCNDSLKEISILAGRMMEYRQNQLVRALVA